MMATRTERPRAAAAILATLLLALVAGCAVLPQPERDTRSPEPMTPEKGDAETGPMAPALPEAPPPGAVDRPAVPVPPPEPSELPSLPPEYHPTGEALVEQARREALLEDPASAGATLERALRIDPSNPWIWIELGYLRLDAGQDAAAESMPRQAQRLARLDPKARAAAGRLLEQAGSDR